ncbi:MAG TPA: bifunctional diaminohydroxyphosphoribosylaminopyrimidine deaminase/5-amino-6-(5-phosphoribosylamino)uracil reductase RibD [Acidobacteriota bacterium]|jgi:diaminohydroxyphosphoribosylaminopyrimidine deaminase/5-amino-6-(5-phosphoribosylamino)uracil reductase
MNDAEFMRRALQLARQGLGRVSPNPAVGAVLVKDGRIVGEGFHQYQEIKHAEVLACRQAADEAWGGTMYVNLEPCSHQGRTPPCCEYLIEKKISRVVAAMKDPNPLVSGKGLERLRRAGVKVEVGLLEKEAAVLNEGFTKFVTLGVPFVTIKSAISLDAKMTSASGERQHFSGLESDARVEALRLQSDAIAVGSQTVLADDPMLTYRGEQKRRRPLVRILLDRHGQIGLDRRLFRDPSPVWWVRPETPLALPRHVTLVDPGSNHASCWRAVLGRMTTDAMYHLLIEGGGETNASALSAGIVDKIACIYAPQLIGGSRAVSMIGGAGFDPPLSLKRLTGYQMGDDFWIEGYLK